MRRLGAAFRPLRIVSHERKAGAQPPHSKFGLGLLLAFCLPHLVNGQHVLQPDGVLERELSGGQAHDYQIALREGQYAFLIVEQRGVDVAIRLDGFNGNIDIGIDNEYRTQGDEKVEIVARVSGPYRLSVRTASINAARGQVFDSCDRNAFGDRE